jgi:hypothetical protein
MFWRKLYILIQDLYPYNIKIQTNINQKLSEICEKIKNCFKGFLDFF